MGESEILGNKVEDVSLAFLLPKMYIDCSWKETIPRGMVRLNGSQSLFNILIAWTCFFMFHNNNLGSKWLPWRESWLHQEGYKMLKASPLGDDQEEAFGVEKCVVVLGCLWLYRLQRGQLCGLWKTRRASHLPALGLHLLRPYYVLHFVVGSLTKILHLTFRRILF